MQANHIAAGRQIPGNILALNTETGVEHYVRPEMLEIMGNPWKVLDTTNIPKSTSGDTKLQAEANPSVVLKADGTPFKTEESARKAMKTKELSENEWIILPNGTNGFIISKV